MTDRKPRFGLIGTGIWARTVQAPAAATCDAVHFCSVFGRREIAAKEIAEAHGAQAFTSLGAFLDSVDIVGISLVPDAQPEFAIAAAAAGKHLLLEKPLATDPVVADAIAEACAKHGVQSAVFFTRLFTPQIRQWVNEAAANGGWLSARTETFARVISDPGNPFYSTRWRSEVGALWDVGPHAVSLLCAALGDVVAVSASKGRGDFTLTTLVHDNGVISTIAITLDAPSPLPGGTVLFGASGKNEVPVPEDWNGESTQAYRNAIAELATAAKSGQPTPYDARFGARVTTILAAAEQSIASGHQVSLDKAQS
ncbi:MULTISPECIES: Gfo/Idh/MocA family protein [Rhizobium]|uniref:Gfo/Idh/MocA family protein n=1 Tax=Rhizobium TaxID=379 RepID=UPI00195951BF|nr:MULTISPECIES: Gfo/Idh/MocA family oxidoreductase [Rhizobium]MBM7044782.1 Gfo/Idh/MocA family oxidoreductase [Rhizobium lusitanum]